MRAIPKTVKIHPAAKKCCGWEKPAICLFGSVSVNVCTIFQYLSRPEKTDILPQEDLD